MANNLTGDFDVVAEFSIPAANRVLAGMHRAERMLHSISVRVDDNPPPGHHVDDAALVAVVDRFGDASVDHNRIPTHPTRPPVRGGGSPGSTSSMPDSIVNLNVAGVHVEPLVPSRLQGRAQVQLSPPTIHVPDNSGKNVTVKMELRARYFPDPQTPRVAEFVRGDLAITAPVDQVASQDQILRVVEIDIKGVAVVCNFTRTWSSTPISAEDLAGVNQLIRNSLRNSFLPSSEALPAGIDQVQFKTLRSGRDALAVLLNMEGGPGDPATQTNVFLGTGDDFAIGAGVDYVRKEFQPTIDSIRNQHIDRIPVLNITYEIQNVDPNDHRSQLSVDFALENGRIMLTISGKAHTPHWWAPDFVFTVRQPLMLVPNGATAELVVGDIDLTTDDFVADRFKGPISRRIKTLRDQSLADSGAAALVRKTLNADEKLGGLIGSLLRPTKPGPGWLPPDYGLWYTSVDIGPTGIVLHGSLAVTDWPAPHVEFERVPSSGGGPHVDTSSVLDEPQYSGLKTWIPGGAIDDYEWSTEGHAQGFRDENRFIYQQPRPGVSSAAGPSSPSVPPTPVLSDGGPATHGIPGYVPLCLTVRGTRLSSSGPVAPQPASASVCGYSSFPIVGGFGLATAGFIPMVALTQPSPEGMVEVTGHAAAATATSGAPTPNLLVHFAGEPNADMVGILTQALRESGRRDAATAVLAVVGKEQLPNTTYIPGVVYAEQDAGAWERVFDLKGAQRSVTMIVGPNRDVLWKHEGNVDRRTLAEALRKSLVRAAPVSVGMLRSSVRIGHAPPNFLFEYAPGRNLTLRKLAGRPVALVFWKSSSQPSIEAVRELQHELVRNKAAKEMVLAINDGDTPETAQKTAAENNLSATVVSDPDRKISSAYGINIWPTILSIGASGLVSGVSYGRTDAHSSETASHGKPRSNVR